MQSIEIARQLADAANDAWQDMRTNAHRHETVGYGPDGTATTLADQVLDKAMLGLASQLDIDVLSEESGRIGDRGGPIAVVDPLDGSRNAGRGIPAYCTSVAIGQTGLHDVTASVVINLATGDRFEASDHATFNGNRVTLQPHNPEEVMVALIGDQSDIDVMTNLHQRGLHMRDLGSAALELCLVGTGALDAFHVPQPWLRVIDIAGGVHFVRQAGGHVLDPVSRENLEMPFNLDERRGLLAICHNSMLEAIG